MTFWKSSTAVSSKLVFTNGIGVGITTWLCSGLTVQSQSLASVAKNVTSTTTVNLTGPTGVHYYSDSSCTTEITSLSIISGSNQVSFYWMDGKQGSPTVTAAATGFATGTQSETVSGYGGCTWLGTTTAWNTTSNWSCGHVPTTATTDIAIFDTNCTNCSPAGPTAASTPYGLFLTKDYTGTVSLGITSTMTVGAGGCTLVAGTLTQSSKAFTCSGKYAQRGGAYNGGTAATNLNGGIYIYGGTMTLSSTSTSGTLTTSSANGLQLTGGTITMGKGVFTVSNSAANSLINGGTFTGGSGTVSFSGTLAMTGGTYSGGTSYNNFSGFALSGGSFTGTPAGIDATSWAVTGSPTFNMNGGGLTMTPYGSPTTITVGSETYYDVDLEGTNGGYTLTGTMNVTGTLTIGDAGYFGYAMNGGTINWTGSNMSIVNYGDIGTTVIKVAGKSTGQTITGSGNTGGVPNLTIAAGTNPVTFSSTVAVEGNYIVSSAGTFTATGSTLGLLCDYQTCTITPGTLAYNNVSFAGYDADMELGGATMTVNGNLLLEDTSGAGAVINAGTINVYGTSISSALAGSNTGGGYQGTATVVVAGNASGQTVSGVAGAAYPNLQIKAGTNPVTFSNDIDVTGNYTYTSSGTFSASGSTLELANDVTVGLITPGIVTYGNVSLDSNFAGLAITGTLNAAGNVVIGCTSGAGYSATGTINVGGNLTYNNGGYTGALAVNLTGASPTITVTGTPGIPTGNVTVAVSGTATLASAWSLNSSGQSLSVTSGAINMNGNNLTVKNTLSLSSGTSITRGSGTLKVNGATIGAGAYSSGTIN